MSLGVDEALMRSGFAQALQRAFGVDTGIAVKLQAGTALDMLEAAELGEQDAVLTNAPRLEVQVEKQGLVHDRRAIARCEHRKSGVAPRSASAITDSARTLNSARSSRKLRRRAAGGVGGTSRAGGKSFSSARRLRSRCAATGAATRRPTSSASAVTKLMRPVLP